MYYVSENGAGNAIGSSGSADSPAAAVMGPLSEWPLMTSIIQRSCTQHAMSAQRSLRTAAVLLCSTHHYGAVLLSIQHKLHECDSLIHVMCLKR